MRVWLLWIFIVVTEWEWEYVEGKEECLLIGLDVGAPTEGGDY